MFKKIESCIVYQVAARSEKVLFMSQRIKLCFHLFCITFLLSACFMGTNKMFFKSPEPSRSEIWICEEPFAYFMWNGGFRGEIVLDNTLYPCDIGFGYGGVARFFMLDGDEISNDYENRDLLSTDFNYSKDLLVLTVRKDVEGYRYTDYCDELVFIRYDFDPERDELPSPPKKTIMDDDNNPYFHN